MPNEDSKILKYNLGEKSLKAPFMIFADLQCLLEKIHSCQNNPKKYYTEKKTKHRSSSYSLFTNFHLIRQKTNLIVTEEKTARKSFVKA